MALSVIPRPEISDTSHAVSEPPFPTLAETTAIHRAAAAKPRLPSRAMRAASERSNAGFTHAIHSDKCGLVESVVTNINDGRVGGRLLYDGLNRAALVAPHTQLHACFKREQREPRSSLPSRLKHSTSLLFNSVWLVAAEWPPPVHHHRVGLVFEQPAERITSQAFSQFIQFVASLLRRLLHLAGAVGKQPLCAVQPPHFPPAPAIATWG